MTRTVWSEAAVNIRVTLLSTGLAPFARRKLILKWGPKDELIAAHNAAMECYRRAMIGEQTFEGRREALNQANKLSRTYAILLEALNRHRGKGQQKVTVEHVHVHSGGQAVVGVVGTLGGRRVRETGESTPCKANCPCTSARDAARGRGTRAGANRLR
jgi:hypothetical protein